MTAALSFSMSPPLLSSPPAACSQKASPEATGVSELRLRLAATLGLLLVASSALVSVMQSTSPGRSHDGASSSGVLLRLQVLPVPLAEASAPSVAGSGLVSGLTMVVLPGAPLCSVLAHPSLVRRSSNVGLRQGTKSKRTCWEARSAGRGPRSISSGQNTRL